MSRMLTVGFEYGDDSYYSISLVKENGGHTEYKITVMNGAIQSQLTNNNVIKQVNGFLHVDTLQCEHLTLLKLNIAKALGKLLNLPVQIQQKANL